MPRLRAAAETITVLFARHTMLSPEQKRQIRSD